MCLKQLNVVTSDPLTYVLQISIPCIICRNKDNFQNLIATFVTFRVENEHLTNVGKFRAFKSVPLPFNYDEDEDKDD